MPSRKLAGCGFLFLFFALLPFSALEAKPLEVIAGELDLRQTPPSDENGILTFSGPWRYIPGELLQHIPKSDATPLFADPIFFWQESFQDQFQKAEHGTFFLTVHRLQDHPQLSLWLSEMPRYRLYINGRLAASQGFWKKDGGGFPSRGHRQVTLPDTERVEIVLQTSTEGPRWQPWPQALSIGTIAGVQGWVQERTIILALILGGIFVTGVYHILLFVLNRRKKAPLLLGLFCLAHVLRNVLGSEIDTVFHIWPHFPYELSYKLGYSAFFFVAPLYIHFLFLSFRGTIALSFVWGSWLFSSAFVALAVFTPVMVYCAWSQLYHIALLLTIILMVYCLIQSLRRQLGGAYTLLTGTLIMVGATINDILFFRGTIQSGELTPFAVFIFILLQASILSAQVASAFRELRHTYKELTKIAHLHMVQKIAAGFRIEQTMPIGTAEGTVLCFDIVGSSRIRHPSFHDVIERMMGRCYAAMSLGYNPETLECRAYRVKEMGDGLLCSIGFPFHLPHASKQNQAQEALQLALEFTRIFREEMQTMDLEQNAYCSVGIASGRIEGFFPRFGIKQYDLRGHTIVLANRYESMRNQVYQNYGRQGSVIFIQDAVFQRLSPAEQEAFQNWDCTAEQQRIRDDPQAQQAWFRFVEPAHGRKVKSVPQAS